MELETLKGLGKSLSAKLEKGGIHSVEALLLHLPKSYEDRRVISKIASVQAGQKALIEGVIQGVNVTPFGKKHLSCFFTDDTGGCQMHLFRFYPNQVSLLKNGAKIRCYGEIIKQNTGANIIELIHPEWQIINQQNGSLKKGITPVYPSIDGISSHVIYKFITQLKDYLFSEYIPDAVLKRFNLISINHAIQAIHFPPNKTLNEIFELSQKARYRLALEEILAHHLNAKIARDKMTVGDYVPFEINLKEHKEFLTGLSFTPTKAQMRVIDEIFTDFSAKKPISRLIQGDVGSGKTLIAAACLIQASLNNFQSIIMAPTEILAEQHYHNLKNWLETFDIPVIFVAQKLTKKARETALDEIQQNPNCVVVGTHAVFQESMHYPNLALVIIDEQHRFGVEQRLALIEKAKSKDYSPHQIVMTATPIPRTLAMTVYGDLDLSVIDELPPNRKPIKTSVLSEEKKAALIQKLEAHVEKGGQAYWVCPLIESSEVLTRLQDVSSLYERVKNALPNVRVGLIHGAMKATEKALVMADFKAHKLDMLVATTVIEVGVDVPNANIMIIDNAERLGLSQLHQLRGRVGRGHKESNCILLYQAPLSVTARKRLELMRQTQDGFVIAEEDLKLRGPGDIFGKNQTGDIHFKVADLSMHQSLFNDVTEIASVLVKDHPESVGAIIERWLKNADQYIKA